MLLRHIKKVLLHHDNCYVKYMPSDNQLRILRKMFNCEIKVRNPKFIEEGYVLEKGVKLDVGN